MCFAKIPMGGQGFQEKLPGGSPYFWFYCIFINKCLKIFLSAVLYLPSPLTPPVCIYDRCGGEGVAQIFAFLLSR
jgi:hypothetical protein